MTRRNQVFLKNKKSPRQILVVGTGPLAQQLSRDIKDASGSGLHIKGFAGDRERLPENEPFLCGLEDLDRELEDPEISEVVIALEPEEFAGMREIISLCDRNGVRFSVIPFCNDLVPSNPVIETIGSSKLIHMRTNRLDHPGWGLIKRGFDILAGAAALILLSPLMAIIAIRIRLGSPGPVLFRQTRVGYKRKEFQMLKFRSMYVNSEEDSGWTTDADPRRTKFGSLIRKYSLDELPQLFNVLKGDMSLVGPRPELPHFVKQFRDSIPRYMLKHQVKPGMTGWAQVNGYRGDTSIEKRIDLDLWYIGHWSVWLDLKILLRTLFGGMVNRERI